MEINPTPVWCRLLSPDNKILGDSFRVYATDIEGLKNQVKAVRHQTLQNVEIAELAVFQCKNKKLFDHQYDVDELQEIINGLDFNDKTQVSKPPASAKVHNLGLAETEILLFQIPGFPPILCLSCYLLGGEHTDPFEIEIEREKTINTLKKVIKLEKSNTLRDVEASDLILWKVDIEHGPALKERVEQLHLANGNALEYFRILSDVFPSALSQDKVHIVIVALPRKAQKRGFEVDEGSSVKRQRFLEARTHDVILARGAYGPSSAATIQRFGAEQRKRPVLNGRPHCNSGPPIGLFHSVFNTFQATMNNQERFIADATTYSSVRSLFEAFAKIYDKEDDRIRGIEKPLTDVLGTGFVSSDGPGVKSSGVVMQRISPYPAYLAILEVKNEIGTGGTDPYNQGSLAYRKYWVSSHQDRIREHSYCPSIILAIAGPWLCVLGGVYLEQAVVQPLTDYVWLGGDDFNEERLVFGARLFSALKTAISILGQYYTDLEPCLASPPLASGAFPFVTEFESQTFTYKSRLVPAHPNKLLYKAVLEDKASPEGKGRAVVVKFASTYNAEAHRLLANHKLAPALHYAGTGEGSTMYGGRYMIVMDLVEPKEVMGSLSAHHLEQIHEAIKILHEQNLVFGDLRPPNILITDAGVQLVDFDWCGTAGKQRYPANMNMAEEIGWAEGMGPDCIMLQQHDLAMLEKLPSRY